MSTAELSPIDAAALAVCRQYRWDTEYLRYLYNTVQFGSRAEAWDAAELRRVYHRAWRWAFAGRRSPPPKD